MAISFGKKGKFRQCFEIQMAIFRKFCPLPWLDIPRGSFRRTRSHYCQQIPSELLLRNNYLTWIYRGVLKLEILKCLVWPVMGFGCISWTMKNDDTKRVETALNEISISKQMPNLINRSCVGYTNRSKTKVLMSTAIMLAVEGKRNPVTNIIL